LRAFACITNFAAVTAQDSPMQLCLRQEKLLASTASALLALRGHKIWQNPELLQLQKLVKQAKARKDQLEKDATQGRSTPRGKTAIWTPPCALSTTRSALDPKDTNAPQVPVKGFRRDQEAPGAEGDHVAPRRGPQRDFCTPFHGGRWGSIRKAESLTPGVTQSGSLRNVVAASREQEMRRIASIAWRWTSNLRSTKKQQKPFSKRPMRR